MIESASKPQHHSPATRKSLSERIAARIQQQADASTAARNRSVFISLREDIQQAVTDGWSLLAIWQVLFDEKRVTFTYQAFRRYARQLIDSPTVEPNCQPRHAAKPAQTPTAITRPFAFNPTPAKEHLL